MSSSDEARISTACASSPRHVLCTLRHYVVILFKGRSFVVSRHVTRVYPEKLILKSRQDAFV